ncbi:MAG: ferredoxin [Candidatus Riflebacteria bacterium]|nr:ferredoxin [Candidatus Riflebacteria bacterium]
MTINQKDHSNLNNPNNPNNPLEVPAETLKTSRRDFLKWWLRLFATAGFAWTGFHLKLSSEGDSTWQLDPQKCIQCEKCAAECVLTPSAVKCVHIFKKCGYCDLCSGYFIKGATNLNTAAENQLCPTGALKRTYVEEPFFQYTIDEALCLGCGKCVKNCRAFGNSSLILQIKHDLCLNCNQCKIALSCPSGAFKRVSAQSPYLFDGKIRDNAA